MKLLRIVQWCILWLQEINEFIDSKFTKIVPTNFCASFNIERTPYHIAILILFAYVISNYAAKSIYEGNECRDLAQMYSNTAHRKTAHNVFILLSSYFHHNLLMLDYRRIKHRGSKHILDFDVNSNIFYFV